MGAVTHLINIIMTHNTLRRFELGALLAILIAASIGFSVFSSHKAEANPSGFSCPAYSSIASSSPVYLGAGTATSTLLYDTYCVNGTNQPNTGNTRTTNTLALLTQFTASSTSSVMNASVEYSQDGIDWYQDNYLISGVGAVNIQAPVSYTWTYVNSTIGGIANSGNRLGKVVRIYPPTRYVRVVYSLTGANGAVWGQILPIKEAAN